MAKCKWCGSEYEKKHNRQMYCNEYCSKEGKKENGRIRFRKYYHKYKNVMTEEERCGLGSGYLSEHRHESFDIELIAIEKEIKKLKIKA